MRNACVSKCVLGFLGVGVFLFVFSTSGYAKMYEEPRSFALKDTSQEQVDRKVLPQIDAQQLAEAERTRTTNSQRPGPFQFAVAATVDFTLVNSGTWQTLADGRVWRLRIWSPGALSLSLGITRFEMPEGAKLWIYDPSHQHVEGPYTLRNRSQRGSLWTPIIEGDEVVVEVFVPTGVAQPVVEISQTNQGFRGFGKQGVTSSPSSPHTEGMCEKDVICPYGDPWRDQIRAVAVYVINGQGFCTGTLLNNTALDFRPVFLSANHCFFDWNDTPRSDKNGHLFDPDTIVVYWNYEAMVCGTHDPGPLSAADTQTGGAQLRARYAASDFLLLELNSTPVFNVWYAGWDANGMAPPSTAGIHHPEGDAKAISLSNSSPQNAFYSILGMGLDPNGNHWQVDWSTGVGVTELGSSGSCIFATDTKRCIGQLHGGGSACNGPNQGPNPLDYYGKLSVSWAGGGTADTSLKGWLDPIAPPITLALDGDPHITTMSGGHYDLQGAGEFVSVRDANGLEIQTRMVPIATTFNPGPDPHDGLATCVSLNTAVAARVGSHRVTYQPNLSGVPDPSGLQLRVDGVLATLGPRGRELGNGGRIARTTAPGGLQIDFPDGSVLLVTPGWWTSQSTWYLNVGVHRPASTDGMAAAARGQSASTAPGGITGVIAPGNWLPALPNGSSMGPMPGASHERYIDLYQRFANAWRVTDETSLFDYAPGTSTDTFTMRSWPPETPPCVLPNTIPAQPASERVAQQACQGLTDPTRRNCIFDVTATGNLEFAKTYALSQRIQVNSTRTLISQNMDHTKVGDPVSFVATVTPLARNSKDLPVGTVQFMLNGANVGQPLRLDAKGVALWTTSTLKPGQHDITARFIPGPGSSLLPSTSPKTEHTVRVD
jgi:lysyl endopeptidase